MPSYVFYDIYRFRRDIYDFLATQQEKLTNVKELIALLKRRLLNRKILDMVVEKIYQGAKRDNIIAVSLEGITIFDKESEDSFILCFSRNAISVDFVSWRGRHQERTVVTFDGDETTVDYQEAITYLSMLNQQPSGTERKQVKKVYEKNQLRYKREFESSTTTDLERNMDYTALR